MAYRKTNVRENDVIPVPGGLNKGSQIIIRGRVEGHQARFAVNLKCGEEDDADIAFHFNPRNDDGDTVVRNTRTDGDWQEEERDIPGFPFDNGRKFTLRIVTLEDCYRVLVNSREFIRYNHRISPENVQAIHLTSGAEYYEVTVQNNCRVPFYGQFPGGLKVGQSVRVRGMVKDDADRFDINFQYDRDGDTVAFHFNPRQDDDVVVCNTKDGDWGEEEKDHHGDFPFHKGEFFDAFFVVLEDNYSVFVNEKLFTTYNHRKDFHDVRYLRVRGDVELMDVELLDPLPDDFLKEIPQGLEKNDLIVVKGFFFKEGERFAVNLIKGTSLDDDIALHFNPRRDDNEVVINSKDGGDWEEEERHALPYSMTNLAPFQVEILTKSDKFKIYSNNKKVCKFRARDDIEDIKSVNVRGDAFIYEVKIFRRLDEPFMDEVPLTLEPGNWLEIIGCPDDDADRFAVNLMCGSDPENDDIAFHFNPRFSEGEVVRNTRVGGDWGEEERDQTCFPFEQEDRFELRYTFLPHGIRTFVNGQKYVDYNFRTDPNSICHIFLSGGCDYFEPEFY